MFILPFTPTINGININNIAIKNKEVSFNCLKKFKNPFWFTVTHP